MELQGSVGIVGGNGQLGGAIARGCLRARTLAAERLWISCRSGRAEGFGDWPGIRFTPSNQELAGACDTVILSVPPAAAGEIGIRTRGLVISVMAGVPLDRLANLTGATRVIRAMSSPAAADALAYSPWVASAAVTAADRATARAIFGACGLTDEIEEEGHIDFFTALTGPVPGFVALMADCMIRHAAEQGIDPALAERAVRQLFLASGEALGRAHASPADAVNAMVDYAGTTAAGIEAMRSAGLDRVIAAGLEAATKRAREMGR
ncbi:MAG: pyrroline-5-carboxylate reductase dimerization domain-containing protein [Paracoccaceae bacterium]